MGGGSSSSSSDRVYNTTNVSQQGEAVAYGQGNTVTVYRADAVTLDNIAAALAKGVENLTDAATSNTQAVLDANTQVVGQSLDVAENVATDALDKVTDLAMEIQQGAETGTQQAMDFVANYTEREQVGTEAQGLRTLVWVAGVAAVAMIGVAWASKGGMKA